MVELLLIEYPVSSTGKKDGKLYAMKVLSKPNVLKRKQVEHTKTERRVLGGTSHPFVNSLHCAFQTSGKLYLVLNYCAGGEVAFFLAYHLHPVPVITVNS